MPSAIERLLEIAQSGDFYFGEIAIRRLPEGRFALSHVDDAGRNNLQPFGAVEDALAIAKFDDEDDYRPLKTAPNLRHGWQLDLANIFELAGALDYFYPGRLAVFRTWKADNLTTTPLRETLNRQTGMYRIAAKISDEQINEVVGSFCRSEDGCLRKILWKRDAAGDVPSTKLPPDKFDPRLATASTVPLLCQEACNLLIAKCRSILKGE